jgi:hypothetical protein
MGFVLFISDDISLGLTNGDLASFLYVCVLVDRTEQFSWNVFRFSVACALF